MPKRTWSDDDRALIRKYLKSGFTPWGAARELHEVFGRTLQSIYARANREAAKMDKEEAEARERRSGSKGKAKAKRGSKAA